MKITEHLPSRLVETVRSLLSDERWYHTLCVVEWCTKLAKRFELDWKKCALVGLLHDMFRDTEVEKLVKMARVYNITPTRFERAHPVLLHGKVAAEYAKRTLEIDEEMYMAIAFHSSGHPELGGIGKALVVSDSVAKDREYEDVETLRCESLKDLNTAYIKVIAQKITYAVERRLYVLQETVETWNEYLERSDLCGI